MSPHEPGFILGCGPDPKLFITDSDHQIVIRKFRSGSFPKQEMVKKSCKSWLIRGNKLVKILNLIDISGIVCPILLTFKTYEGHISKFLVKRGGSGFLRLNNTDPGGSGTLIVGTGIQVCNWKFLHLDINFRRN